MFLHPLNTPSRFLGVGQTLSRNGDGKSVSRKEKERKKDERVGELESMEPGREQLLPPPPRPPRPRVPTEPAHAWWGRGEGKVGRFRDGGRWYCRVEFERTVLRMEIRRRVLSSIPRSLLSLSLSTTPSPLATLPLTSPRSHSLWSLFPRCSVFLSLPSETRTLCFDLRGGPLSYKMVARRRFCSFNRSGSGGASAPPVRTVSIAVPRVDIVWGNSSI